MTAIDIYLSEHLANENIMRLLFVDGKNLGMARTAPGRKIL